MKHAILLVLLSLGTQAPVASDWQGEFPRQDSQLVWSLARAYERIDADERFKNDPADIETVRALAIAEDYVRLLRSLRLIVDKHPERLAETLKFISLHELRGDTEETTRHREGLLRLVGEGRKRLDSLSREDAAPAALALTKVENALSPNGDLAQRLRTFVNRYSGTKAARLAEVDLIIRVHTPSPQMIDALDAFAARHPGTEAAAKAIYQLGYQYSSSNMRQVEGRPADPIRDFERVEAAARELQSGRYPDSEWTRRAPELITQFSILDGPEIPDRSLERLIAALEGVARSQFDIALRSGAHSVPEFVIASKLPRLYARRGDRTAQFEQFLSTLEGSPEASATASWLRATYYLQAQDHETPEKRQLRISRAKTALRAASDAGDAVHNRRALATLASIEFDEGDCAASLRTLREYLDRYPLTAWSWVALIRTGQCEETLGKLDAAIAAFRLAAETGTGVPPAQVIGRAYAGRLLEATGAIEAARGEYAQALDAWDPRFGPRYSTYVRLRPSRSSPFGIAPQAAEITSASLAQRVSHLTQALARPGGVLLAQARARLERGDYEGAGAAAARVLTEHPTSDLSADAHYVAHLARLEHALVLADTERPGHDIARAEEMLDALAREPHDFAVSAARIARATMRRLRGGDATAQERVMKASLEELHARQQFQEPAEGIEADIAAIRRAVFLPRGGGVYGAERWNAFKWSDATTPFFILSADLSVKRHDGEVQRFTLAHPLPAAPEALFLERGQIDLLERMIVSLGGTKRAEPTHTMQTPNQPVGGAREIVTFWNRFFPARQGHWVGWELEAYPRITEIHFTNAERTKASVRVTIGYSGGTVELDKEGGQWKARRLVGRWIT